MQNQSHHQNSGVTLPVIPGAYKSAIYHDLKYSNHLVSIDSGLRSLQAPDMRSERGRKKSSSPFSVRNSNLAENDLDNRQEKQMLQLKGKLTKRGNRYKTVEPKRIPGAKAVELVTRNINNLREQNVKGGPDRLSQLVNMMEGRDQRGEKKLQINQSRQINQNASQALIANQLTQDISGQIINELDEVPAYRPKQPEINTQSLKKQFAMIAQKNNLPFDEGDFQMLKSDQSVQQLFQTPNLTSNPSRQSRLVEVTASGEFGGNKNESPFEVNPLPSNKGLLTKGDRAVLDHYTKQFSSITRGTNNVTGTLSKNSRSVKKHFAQKHKSLGGGMGTDDSSRSLHKKNDALSNLLLSPNKSSDVKLPSIGNSPSSHSLSQGGHPIFGREIQSSSFENSLKSPNNQHAFDVNGKMKIHKNQFGLNGANRIALRPGVSPEQRALNLIYQEEKRKQMMSNELGMKQIESMKSLLENTQGDQPVTDAVNGQADIRDAHIVIDASLTPTVHTFNQKTRKRNKNVSYNLLANDKDRSEQLMRIFDKKLQKMGQAQEALKQEDPLRKEKTDAKLELLGYELSGTLNKPGFPQPIVPVKIQKDPSLYQVGEEIAEKYQHMSEDALLLRQEARNRINNLLKHKKAVAIVSKVHKKADGRASGMLALDPNSGDPRLRARRNTEESESKSEEQEKQADFVNPAPKTFQQEYDYESYVNKDNDSDLAEDEIFNALNNHESTGAQNVLSVSTLNRRKPEKPEVLKEKQVIDPHKGTKYEKLVYTDRVEEKKEEYTLNDDGTYTYTKDQLQMLEGRMNLVSERLGQKQEIRDDFTDIKNANYLNKDLVSLDIEAEVPRVKKESLRKGLQLSRKQADLNFKEDFEIKISKMSDRMQSEIKDLDTQLNFSPDTYGQGKTYKDVLEDDKNEQKERTLRLKEKMKVRQDLQISPKTPSSPASTFSRGLQSHSPGFRLSPKVVPESGKRVTKRTLGQGDPWETREHNQGGILIQDQNFSGDAPGDLTAFLGSGRSPAEQAYPGIPEEDVAHEDQQDSIEAKSQRKRKPRTESIQMLSLAKRNRIMKSEMKAKKRAEKGLGPDELPSSSEEEVDTVEAAKKRARIEMFNKMKDMDSVRRREFLRERALSQAATTKEDDVKEENMLFFFSLISKNEDYPVETITKLLIEQVKEFERVNQAKFSDSKMISKFAQNELINGLCMLKCLKDEEINKQLVQEYEMLQSSSKQILSAVQTIRNFQKERAQDDPDAAGVDFAEILGIREREGYSELTDNQVTDDSTLSDWQVKALRKKKKRKELFNTMIFQEVISKIMGSEHPAKLWGQKADGSLETPRIFDQNGNMLSLTQYKKNFRDQLHPGKPNYADEVKVNQNEASIQSLAKRVNLQSEFFQVCKYAINPKIEEDIGENPALQYAKHAQKAGAMPTPLLGKVVDRTLPLLGYALSDGQCAGLAQAFSGNPRLINAITLDDNGLTDEAFSKIVGGLKSLDSIKSIVYRRNEFQRLSIDRIIPLLARKKPQNLDELRIVGCKIGQAITHDLVEELLSGSSLSKLSLVNVSMSSTSFTSLCEYVEGARNLRVLDISSNDLTVLQMAQFLEVLEGDRKLRDLNLSWNRLMDIEATIVPSCLDPSYDKAAERHAGQFSQLSAQEIFPRKGASSRRSSPMQSKPGSPIQDENEGHQMPATDNSKLQIPQNLTAENPDVAADIKIAEELGEEIDEEEIKGEDESSDEDTKKRGSDEAEGPYDREKALKMHKKLVKTSLSKFIKYNQNLYHLDLSHTGLNENVLKKICTSLSKSRALTCIHLSGNPGINDKNVSFLKERIHCREQKPFKAIDWTPIEGDEGVKKLTTKEIQEKHDHLDQETRQELVEENLKLKHIKHSMKLHDHRFDIGALRGERTLNFCRHLGHKYDMPGSAQWVPQTDSKNPLETCWVCGQWIFSLIFWSKSIGQKIKLKSENMSQETKINIIQQLLDQYPRIEAFDPENPKDIVQQRLITQMTLLDVDDGRPFISGEFTNWEPTRMLRVDEYAQSLDPQTTKKGMSYFDILRGLGSLSPLPINKYSGLSPQEQEKYDTFKQERMLHFNGEWHTVVGTELNYKRPFIGNGEYLSQVQHPQEEQLYVLPCFIRPGKQNYMVIQKEGLATSALTKPVDLPLDDESYYFSKFIVENRTEEVAPFVKPMRIVAKEREFKLEHSVFKAWKQDTEDVLDKCFAHDIAKWKLSKFCKDEAEQERVKQVIRRHMKEIKEIYQYRIAHSNFPALFTQDFLDWCYQIKVPEKEKVMMHFKAANFEAADEKCEGNNNPAEGLIRYEFLEIIVRIANGKYRETGVTKSYADATKLLITNNLQKFDLSQPWDVWRQKVLYTCEVNDLMDPNIPGLKKVYEKYGEARKKYMDVKDAYSLFREETGLIAQEQDVLYCFGMAKMTCIAESKDSERQNGQLQFVEFLEMLGRVAQFKFRADPDINKQPLELKLEMVLDEVLATVDVKRKDPEQVQLDESESDDDY